MKRNNTKIFLKIKFYFMSLWLLFLLAFIITIEIDNSISVVDNFRANVVPIVLFVLSGVSFMLNFTVKDKTKGTINPGCKITKVENKNYEFLTFLTTYIIPLVFIDFNNVKHLIVVLILLIFIGVVFTKMDLYLANPTLALFYKLYELKVEIKKDEFKNITVISKDKLSENDEIEWIPFDDNYWFVRRK